MPSDFAYLTAELDAENGRRIYDEDRNNQNRIRRFGRKRAETGTGFSSSICKLGLKSRWYCVSGLMDGETLPRT